jgi:hypothetical protein
MTWGLVSAVLGAIGTIILFCSSYTLEPSVGAPFGGRILEEHNERIKTNNAMHQRWQSIGFGILCLSFIVQIASALLGL